MKKLWILALPLLLFACDKAIDVPADTPECVKSRIQSIADQPVRNPPSRVYEYFYQGDIVYYISPYCCDFPSLLYTDDCQLLCSPDGGSTGLGDGQCPNFFTEAEFERVIWEDNRED